MKKKSVILSLIIFFLDLAVFGFIIEFFLIMNIGLLGFTFMGLLALISAWRKSKRKGYQGKVNAQSILNFFASIRKYLKINYHTIIIASIGIIIGTAAFGQALILSDVVVGNFVKDQMETESYNFVDITLKTSLTNFVSDPNLTQENLNTNITRIIQNRGYTVYRNSWFGYLHNINAYYPFYNEEKKQPIFAFMFYSNDFLQYGELEGGFPSSNHSNEFLLIYSEDVVLKEPDRNVVYFTEDRFYQNITAIGSITGYFRITELNIRNLIAIGIPIENQRLFYSFLQENNLLQEYYSHTLTINIKYYSNDEKLLNDISRSTRDIQYIMNDISTFIEKQLMFNQKVTSYQVDSELFNVLQSFRSVLSLFKTIILALSLPIFIITSFIIAFTNNLLESKRKKIIFMLKQRGANEVHILITTIFELVIVSLFSGVIGGVLAIPLSSLFSTSTELFTFSLEDFHVLSIDLNKLLNFIAIAFALTISFNLSTAINLAQVTYLEASNPESKRKGIITRYNLDLMSLILGILYALIIYFLRGTAFIYYIGILLILFLPIGFFGLTIGSVMLFTRSFEKIIITFSKWLWKKTEHLPSFALRNLALRKQIVTKVIGLFMISFIFFMFFTSVPASLKAYNEDYNLYYNNGANISVRNINYSTALQIQEFIQNNPNVSSVTLTYSIRYTDQKLYPTHDIAVPDDGFHINMLAIDPDSYFNTVAIYSDYIEKNPIKRLFTNVNTLKDKLQDNGNALVFSQNEYTQGESIEITGKMLENTYYFVNYTIYNSVIFKASGFFDYWPGLILGELRDIDTSKNVYIVTSLQSVFQQIEYVTDKDDNNWRVLIKVPNNDVSLAGAVARAIKSNFTFVYDVMLWQDTNVNRDPMLLMMYSILNSNILFAIVTSLVSISIFNYMTLSERKRELSLLKSLGMVQWQILSMLLIEITFLAIIGILMGLIMGWFSSVMFAGLVYIGGSEIPPMRIIFLHKYNGLFSTLTLMLSVLSSLGPAIKISQEKPGALLRVD